MLDFGEFLFDFCSSSVAAFDFSVGSMLGTYILQCLLLILSSRNLEHRLGHILKKTGNTKYFNFNLGLKHFCKKDITIKNILNLIAQLKKKINL